jgi:hypothetical protein
VGVVVGKVTKIFVAIRQDGCRSKAGEVKETTESAHLGASVASRQRPVPAAG